ncbi:MAG: ABC transporter ATP-binding protein, partial [Pseudomonadota bacterium]|nr:ABC transporter ATP-binding protein [Pseudomonadota bacterium]
MAELRISNLVKRFGADASGPAAVNGLSADIRDGEFFVVLGASGCGNSTLLRLIAGLETATDGEIRCGDALWSAPGRHLRPEDRRVGFVFQSYALWPHLTVERNVSFPAEVAGRPAREWRALAARHLETVGLSAFADRHPAELSGGQRQRVALARVLASDARVVLMDEPLANLDPHLRAAMEAEFADFHRLSGATTLYITHDQREAMGLADRIAVMAEGRFLQVDAPEALYWRPASAEVARFIGRGALLPAELRGGRAAVAGLGEAPARANPAAADGPCGLFVRPEEVRLGGDGAPARVVRSIYRGGAWELTLDAAGHRLEAATPVRTRAGETVAVSLTGGWPLPAPELAPGFVSPPTPARA